MGGGADRQLPAHLPQLPPGCTRRPAGSASGAVWRAACFMPYAEIADCLSTCAHIKLKFNMQVKGLSHCHCLIQDSPQPCTDSLVPQRMQASFNLAGTLYRSICTSQLTITYWTVENATRPLPGLQPFALEA